MELSRLVSYLYLMILIVILYVISLCEVIISYNNKFSVNVNSHNAQMSASAS